MKAYLELTGVLIKSLFRDRGGLFWSFFFPIFFIIMFGSIFSGNGGGGKSLSVGLVMGDTSAQAAFVPEVLNHAFNVNRGSLAQEQALLAKGRIQAIVQIPSDFAQSLFQQIPVTVPILFDPGQRATAPIAVNTIKSMLAGMEQQVTNRKPLINTTETPVSPDQSTGPEIRTIDYLVPGILAMTCMQLGLFTAVPIINMRERGVLKRMRATPLPRSILVAALVTQRLVMSLLQALIILGIGHYGYGVRIVSSWFAVVGMVLFGVLTFICIGAILSAIAKTQESGMPLVQLVNFPMMFLSGIFFPLDMMGGTLRSIASLLPVTYLADAMRHLMLGAASSYSMTTDVLVMGGWLIVSLAVATRLFKWE